LSAFTPNAAQNPEDEIFSYIITDLVGLLRLYSRLPIPQSLADHQPIELNRALWLCAPAGIVIGFCAGLTMLPLWLFGVPDMVLGFLWTGSLMMLTGALHEDGLADVFDGFGGGRDKIRALTIMKDSSIGTYGGAALILTISVRSLCIGDLLSALGFWPTVVAVGLIAGLSRASLTWLWASTPPARSDGLSAQVGQPNGQSTAWALTAGIVLASVLVIWTGLSSSLICLALCAGGMAGFRQICLRKIGGHTGDTLGAQQQLSELILLISILTSIQP
jgi:adenosylcobinamide-GDP ribazoletransferase